MGLTQDDLAEKLEVSDRQLFPSKKVDIIHHLFWRSKFEVIRLSH